MTEGSALTMSTCLSRIQAVSTSRSRTRHAVQSVEAAEGAKATVYICPRRPEANKIAC